MEEKFIIVDTETANDVDCPLTYNIGLVVTDKKGKIYAKRNYLVKDIYDYELELMKQCYYADRLNEYNIQLKEKEIIKEDFVKIKFDIWNLMKKYNIKKVGAYNMLFDYKALNTSQRFITKSAFRYFFPYGTKFFCIWNIACQIICMKTSYMKFCLDNNYVSNKGFLLTNAENVYRFITQNKNFNEEHKGLEDVIIEKEILTYCINQKTKYNDRIYRACWRLPQKKFKKIRERAKRIAEK